MKCPFFGKKTDVRDKRPITFFSIELDENYDNWHIFCRHTRRINDQVRDSKLIDEYFKKEDIEKAIMRVVEIVTDELG